MMNRAEVLQAAKEAVESRGKAYAPPSGNFRRIAALWEPILGSPVAPHEVALCLAALKIARLVEADGSERVLYRGAGASSECAKAYTRLPGGHPEGFIEALVEVLMEP